MLLVIDNYDSFTYNLVQYLGELKVELQVHRNDQITVEQVRALKPERHPDFARPVFAAGIRPLQRDHPHLQPAHSRRWACASATSASATSSARTSW